MTSRSFWREGRQIEEYWITHLGGNFFTGLSSPISSGGLLKTLLMSPGTTLVCFLSVLVAVCSGSDFEEGGKCKISLYVCGLQNAGF